MDYKDLIERLKDSKLPSSKESARAIEMILKERDAAIADIEHSCHRCLHFGETKESGHCYDCWHTFGPAKCWQWRGPQKEDKHEAD